MFAKRVFKGFGEKQGKFSLYQQKTYNVSVQLVSMVQQDTSPIKNKIISFIEKNGPSLPAHIASEIEQSILFSSAFLAELLSEKKLVLSHMRVGSSPLYLIAG